MCVRRPIFFVFAHKKQLWYSLCMEKPFNPTPEDIDAVVREYENEFEVSFEGDLLVTDISDIARECSELIDPVVELFGGRQVAVHADRSEIDSMVSPLLDEFLKQHSELLRFARVRIEQSMMAVQECEANDGGRMLKYYKSDEDIVVEGYVSKIFCAAIPPRIHLDQIIDNPAFMQQSINTQERELNVCVSLIKSRMATREGHDHIEHLDQVIVPLYPDAIKLKKIENFPSAE